MKTMTETLSFTWGRVVESVCFSTFKSMSNAIEFQINITFDISMVSNHVCILSDCFQSFTCTKLCWIWEKAITFWNQTKVNHHPWHIFFSIFHCNCIILSSLAMFSIYLAVTILRKHRLIHLSIHNFLHV